MTINELARAVHENAVAHGWWDEERSIEEIIALIHSEWSEALEEARAGRPMVYKDMIEPFGELCRITPDDERYAGCNGKPEGIAVELVDGVIRIFDYLGKCKVEATENDGSASPVEALFTDKIATIVTVDLPTLITILHKCTANALEENSNITDKLMLMAAAAIALSWVKAKGIDPLKLLLEKHEYNKTRPYKHGKKF